MEFLIFLLIIASAIARSKKDKNKKSARDRETERRRRIQSAWEEATSSTDQGADPWSKSPEQAEQTHMGSYIPREAAPIEKPAAEPPQMERSPLITAMEQRRAAVSAMKELNNTASGSLEFDSSEGEGSKEGRSRYKQGHTVKPFTEADHLHTESSMTGAEPCPPDADAYAHAAPRPAAAAASDIPLSITGDELRRAVIYSEILGKPKGRR